MASITACAAGDRGVVIAGLEVLEVFFKRLH